MKKITMLVLILLIFNACQTKVGIAAESDKLNEVTNTQIRDIDITFLEEKEPNNEVLQISFSQKIPLKGIKMITIKGKEIGNFSFDGQPINTVEISIAEHPEGPHMFKFLMDENKEINEIYRIKNTRKPKH